ncbi:MAG: nucleotidyl transferase AbiEii/AbiGii toxin family protein [Enterobacterales bacterium]|nr:nucleotidyl transferase AbiEii/AbiGii toxin family protein [Enterobacterales bacterium]
MDISDKLDKELIGRYTDVALAMTELNIPFLVVGASARDLFFEYAHDIGAPRKTHDLDFAIQIPNWEAFEQARKALIKRGFVETKVQHRLRKGEIYPIDIVPFGEIADENNIAWPPDGDVQMNVLGFDEALSNAAWFVINNNPKIEIPLPQPPGLILMKFIAWLDREQPLRTKDAQDIKFILKSFEKLPFINEKLYQKDLLEKYDGDTYLIGAELLGQAVFEISSYKSKELISEVFNNDQKIERLVVEMDERGRADLDFNIALIEAFFAGFR